MFPVVLQLLALTAVQADSAFRITTLAPSGGLSWTNALVPGVCTLESASSWQIWTASLNVYSTSSTGQITAPFNAGNIFFRLRSVDVSPTPAGFTNLIRAYGLLGFVWFNVNKNEDWTISDPAASAAYRRGARAYQGAAL